jgi:hypothetical protein
MTSTSILDFRVSDITMPALNPLTTTAHTARISTIPTGTVASSCQTSFPDYRTLRQQNFSTITEYYNNLLSNYTKNYTDYTTQKNSININDRTYAETTLKPNIDDYNKQMITISKAVIDSVDRDTDLIIDQKNHLQQKTTEVETLTNEIKILTDKDNELLILSTSRKDNLNSTKSGTEDKQFTAYIYIGINILLVCLVIGLIIYLVYSNYATKSSNTINNVSRTNMRI